MLWNNTLYQRSCLQLRPVVLLHALLLEMQWQPLLLIFLSLFLKSQSTHALERHTSNTSEGHDVHSVRVVDGVNIKTGDFHLSDGSLWFAGENKNCMSPSDGSSDASLAANSSWFRTLIMEMYMNM